MNKTGIIVILCVLALTSFAQRRGQVITLERDLILLEEPRPTAPRQTLQENTVITIDSVPMHGRYVYLSTEEGVSGWANKRYFTTPPPRRDASKPDEVLDRYRRRYGEPDRIRTYSSSSTNYRTQTWTWNCANGRYRSITFKLDVVWVKDREHTSECISR